MKRERTPSQEALSCSQSFIQAWVLDTATMSMLSGKRQIVKWPAGVGITGRGDSSLYMGQFCALLLC